MILAIVGSRDYDDYDNFKIIVKKYIKKHGTPELIVSGGASGIDSLAEKYAKEFDIPIKIFYAKWKKYGKKAGPHRNTKIVNMSTHILAMPSKSSIGTYDTINKGKKAGLIVSIRMI